MSSKFTSSAEQLATPEVQLESSRRYQVACLIAPLLIYVVLVSWWGYRMREQINPDAVSYIRNAHYVAAGQFSDSVSGYWSPLLSWCIAPFMYFGTDGLCAARVVLAVWGAGLVLASFWLMRSLVRRSGWLGVLALCLIAIDTARLATNVISPDLVMSALLLAYCSTVISHRFARRRSLQILAGLLGGAAYLAKSYALPFFAVHFTFTICQHLAARRGGASSWRRVALAWATGIFAFLILSGPWIGVLSWKYGQLTFSTVARVAHTIIGPADKPRDHPLRHLYRVPPGRISVWETPEILPYNHWSPFENGDYFKHQVRYSIKTAGSIVWSVKSYDVLGISLLALVFLPIVMSRPGRRVCRRKAVWVLGTVAVYTFGFVFVYWSGRYTHPFLFPVCCIYCMAFCTRWLQQVAAWLKLTRSSQYVAIALVVASFAATVAYWTVEKVREARPTAYRRMAEEMKAAGCQGPVASLGSGRTSDGMFLAYHLGESFAGHSEEGAVTQIESALNDFGVQTLVLDPNGERSGEFMEQTSWRKRLVLIGEDGTELYVYVPADAGASKRGRS